MPLRYRPKRFRLDKFIRRFVHVGEFDCGCQTDRLRISRNFFSPSVEPMYYFANTVSRCSVRMKFSAFLRFAGPAFNKRVKLLRHQLNHGL
jgi:hypothetical protein